MVFAAGFVLSPSGMLAGGGDRDPDGPVLEFASYLCVTPPGIPCPPTTIEIGVVFDEAVDPESASDPANYTFYQLDDPALKIPVAEVVSVWEAEIILLLEALPEAVDHRLVVENVRDLEGNVMAPGQSQVIEPFEDPTAAPPAYASVPVLLPNIPNPFNPKTQIRFTVGAGDAGSIVGLDVHDVRGKLIRRLFQGSIVEPGEHQVLWRGVDEQGIPAASGPYFIRLTVGNATSVRKILLAK